MTTPEECVICFEDTSEPGRGGLAPLAACLLDSSDGKCNCTTLVHPACAQEWATRRSECPVCRTQLHGISDTAEMGSVVEIPAQVYRPRDIAPEGPAYRKPLQWCVVVLGVTMIIMFWVHVH